MKEIKMLKSYSDGELYQVDGRYFLVTYGWATGSDTGQHNTLDTEVLISVWTGGECEADKLPALKDSGDWEPVEGFDLERDGEGEVDWNAYAKEIDEVLTDIDLSMVE